MNLCKRGLYTVWGRNSLKGLSRCLYRGVFKASLRGILGVQIKANVKACGRTRKQFEPHTSNAL